MMKSEVKARWVEALRSGKYEQGTGSLCMFGQFCCLGVLNDILGNDYTVYDDFPNARAYKSNFGTGEYGITYSSGINWPWLRGQGLSVEHSQTLADMNDTGSTFDELADWIEENVEVDGLGRDN